MEQALAIVFTELRWSDILYNECTITYVRRYIYIYGISVGDKN